jgi:hypothetical protein
MCLIKKKKWGGGGEEREEKVKNYGRASGGERV